MKDFEWSECLRIPFRATSNEIRRPKGRNFLMWYRRLACSYFFLLEKQARRLYHTLLIKDATHQNLKIP